LLLDSQIKYGFKYGGERVLFDKDEMQDMKVLDKQPGIRLMGFKPRDVLKDYYNIKHSSFIYPDERAIKGSIVVFSALLDRMLKMDKIAICRMTPRSNAQPRFVALLPQKEEIDRDGTQSSPPGFYVVLLPYTDDIRRLQIEKQPKANDDQIALAKAMVKQLRIKFDSRNFENPSLQQHYINLQALALEKRAEDIEVLEDFTLPDEDGMMKYAETIQKFTDSVLPAGYAPDPKKTPKKAKVPKKANTKKRIRDDEGDDASDDDTPNAKRKKEIDIDSIDWSHYVATGKVRPPTCT
jgi:ATP-dependent DNA helicase 2 subunit 1